MGIHTTEIIKQLPSYLMNNRDMAYELVNPFGFNDVDLTELYCSPRTKSVFRDLTSEYHHLGIESVKILKVFNINISRNNLYYIILKINPEMIITQQRIFDIYEPSEDKNQQLIECFREGMDLFRDESGLHEQLEFNDLSSWKCRRIDYSCDLMFSSGKEKQLFLDLTNRTSKCTRRNPAKTKGKNIKEQSTAEKNKSSKAIIYDKNKEVQEHYKNVPDDERYRFQWVLGNRVRFEYQCERNKVESLKSKNEFDDRSILHYLDDDLARRILRQVYEQMVGPGDFRYYYDCDQLLKQSGLTECLSENIYKFMRLVGMKRSLAKAKYAFTSKNGYILKDGTKVKGTLPTYYNYLKNLKALNLNPVIIPKNWATYYQIFYLHNPIDQILPGTA